MTGALVASDPDSSLTIAYSLAPGQSATSSYGTLALNANGTYSYAPSVAAINALPAGAAIMDTFAVRATDGITTVNSTLSVSINGANDAPLLAAVDAGPVTDTPNPDTFAPVTGQLAATDAEGDMRSYALAPSQGATGAYGTLTIQTNGGYSYAPNAALIDALPPGADRYDTFNITVTDGLSTRSRRCASRSFRQTTRR